MRSPYADWRIGRSYGFVPSARDELSARRALWVMPKV